MGISLLLWHQHYQGTAGALYPIPAGTGSYVYAVSRYPCFLGIPLCLFLGLHFTAVLIGSVLSYRLSRAGSSFPCPPLRICSDHTGACAKNPFCHKQDCLRILFKMWPFLKGFLCPPIRILFSVPLKSAIPPPYALP